IAWGTVTAPVGGGTVSYRLFEDPDGAGPAASTQIGGTLTTATITQVVTGLLHTRLNAQYTVQACNSAGCSTPTAAITPNLTQAIGYFKASNTGANEFFGTSMALSSDGSTLAVGAYGPSLAGAVYVFTRTAGVWSQQAYVNASNTGAIDQFGQSVALSSDGSTLAVGALWEDSNATGIGGNQADNSAILSGAVYVFTRTAGVWSQQAYVKASNTGAGDQFGQSVALSSDGSTLAAGAYQEGSNATGIGGNQADNSASGSGAVYVFTRTAGVWSQQAYVKASNTAATDRFGQSVALSSDGTTLAVGASGEYSNATGIGGNQADNSAGDAGAVYVY
ncbi:MAG: integrin, partial [Ramlibacter sp.]